MKRVFPRSVILITYFSIVLYYVCYNQVPLLNL